VARYRQAGEFRVRQREQLRRALQKAAEALGWDILAVVEESDPIHAVAIDVQRLTRAGIRAIERDLECEIEQKGGEIKQLERTVQALSGLAAEAPSAFPTEVAYTYTATQGNGVYVTKEKELLVEDANSAENAAKRLEKGLARFGRLRDQMVATLKQRRSSVREAEAETQHFVQGTHRLVGEVLATLT